MNGISIMADAGGAVSGDKKAREEALKWGEGAGGAAGAPPIKKPKKTEADDLLEGSAERPKEPEVLQSTPQDILAVFKALARNPQVAAREDDECKCALLEILKLRHEYATHPEGWVARKKRSTNMTIQRWGVTDCGSLCSRVGANYQITVPDWQGPDPAYAPADTAPELFVAGAAGDAEVTDFVASLEPLYKAYVLARKDSRVSYRDMGCFREYVLQTLHAHAFDRAAAEKAVRAGMTAPAAFEAALPYEVWTQSESKSFRAGFDKFDKKCMDSREVASKVVPDKPLRALVSYYYRSKHVDGACRRGPVMLVNTPRAPGQDGDVPENILDPERTLNWLQVRCECRRWCRVAERARYLYQICQDCEQRFCLCPACSAPVMLPDEADAQDEDFACPNCSHHL